MNKGKSEQVREKIVLLVYGIYTVVMAAITVIFRWEKWIVPAIAAGLLLCIILHYKKIGSYHIRAIITSVLAWTNVTIYAVRTNDFHDGLPVMAAVIVLTAVYCLPDIINVSLLFYSLLLLHRLILVEEYNFDILTLAGFRTAASAFSVYVVICVSYLLTRTQSEVNRALIKNIVSIQGAEQSKDDFMANMSHEIRTPINTICGLSEMLLRRELTDDIRKEIVDIKNSGRDLLAIVSDILDFSELTSGKMEVIPGTYNVTSMLNDVINMTAGKAEEKKLELIVNCDPDIPCGLIGDEQKIRRAFMNIMDNALKFTNEGGVIVTLSARKELYGVNLIISVQDTGIGMDEKALEKLFTNYNQVDSKRDRQQRGLGLGLPITKAIVNKMDGFISVSSEPGKGTKVQLVIPQKVVAEEPIVKINGADKMKILLYINMNKYRISAVRDGYAKTIADMTEGLELKVISCVSLQDLKRRFEKESFSHVFISWEEYCEDRDFFEELASGVRVVIVLDRDHKESFIGSSIISVYKPLYVLAIAAVLNGSQIEELGRVRSSRFIAPDARVLVVDDNKMNLKVIEGLLRPYRVQVHVAENGRRALEMLDDLRIDMIFMDHMMPEMDGVETFHELRKKSGSFYQNVPVIALTANAIGGAREMFIKEGFADYLTKPIELTALERVLYRFIPDNKIMKSSDVIHDIPEYDNAKATGELVIEGIDTKLGIGYCSGNVSDYIDVIRIYYEIGVVRIDDIRRYFNAKDWENYTILVHAVKSTSLNIGAVKLSNMAKRLETAGKEKRERIIAEENDDMLAEYERVIEAIRNCRAVNISERKQLEPAVVRIELREITEEEALGHLEKLKECLASYEIETVEKYTDTLNGCSYMGVSMHELLHTVVEKVKVFDFMSAEEELDKIIEKLR